MCLAHSAAWAEGGAGPTVCPLGSGCVARTFALAGGSLKERRLNPGPLQLPFIMWKVQFGPPKVVSVLNL